MTQDNSTIDIHFKDLSYEVRVGFRGRKKPILKGLDGIFRTGELTAIMGPSGAGKSTLLNILSGFQQGKFEGSVKYFSHDGKKKWDKYRKHSCYIQQTDYLYDLFTVYESMTIAAYLKIGKSMTQKSGQVLINDILNTLNLLKVKDTRAERLSGGQKKRLSIALELIDNLPVMFLDEPTTGLDSLSSLQCISALQTVAKNGRTVICTIHQPSAALYQMFDYIYLVVDGWCMYAGTPDDTVSYFARQGLQCPKYHNPADYMLEVVSREYGDHNEQLIAAAEEYCRKNETPMIQEEPYDEQTISRNSPTEMTRFWVLLHRCVLLSHRDWITTRLKFAVHFLVGVLIGLLYEHAGNDANKTISNISYMFVSVVYLSYTSMMPAVLKFPCELAVLKKERFNNWYQLKTYYMAMLVSNVPLHMLLALVYSIISYSLSGQPLELHRFLMYLLIAVLTTITYDTMGLGLGTIFNPINGTFVGSIMECMMVSLGGFLIFFSHMPVYLHYISYLNCLKYSFEGVMQAVYGGDREKLHCPSHAIYCHYRMPSMILDELSMSRPTYWLDTAILFGHFVVLRIIVYVLLKRRLSKIRKETVGDLSKP